jgi:DNA-binding CsgD family transcriptional regulator
MTLDQLSSFSQVVLLLYELAQSQGEQDFQDMALAALKGLIPFNAAMWGSATMSPRGIDIHTLHLHNTSMQMIEDYQKVKHLDHFAQDVSRKEKDTLRFSARDAQNDELRDFLFAHRHMHGLITQCINPQTQFVQWLSLFRHDADAVCSEEDVKMLDALFPHVMQALAANRRLHMRHWLGDVGQGRWSVAIADRRGTLYHADPEFHSLIAHDFASSTPQQLAPEILRAGSEPSATLCGERVVLAIAQDKDLLYLKARAKVLADALSAKEFSIAQMIASGLSLKAIAEQLNRSPETVRTYSKAIYKKLGTSKATQLSALLMQRT